MDQRLSAEPYRITVTGHRHLWKYGRDTERRLKQEFLRFAHIKWKEHGVIMFNIGMAIGADMACAQVCDAHSNALRFTAYIPCINQECKWPKEQQELYGELLRSAVDVIFVSEAPYTTWCMQKRNEAMVDRCSEVWACFSGESGGTANCIKYAHKKNVPVTIWNPIA